MFKFVLVPVAAIALEITTDEWGRFPVIFSVDNSPVDGFAALDLVSEEFGFLFNGRDNRRRVQHLIRHATGVSISGSDPRRRPLQLSFRDQTQSNSEVEVVERSVFPDGVQRLKIPATPGSLLAQSVSSFLTTPISSSQNMVVFNPENPTQYAFENELFYAQPAVNHDWGALYGHRDLWGVNTAIRFANDISLTQPVGDSVPFIPCLIGNFPRNDESGPENFHLPSAIIQDFARIALDRGLQLVRTRDGPRTFFLSNVEDDTVLDTFPTLQYIVQMEDGAEINVISLRPREYIVPTDVPNRRLVRFAQAGIPNYCTFNKALRDRMVIHFDTTNHRIGFGEPLVEL